MNLLKNKRALTSIVVILAILITGGSLYYYFNFIKPKTSPSSSLPKFKSCELLAEAYKKGKYPGGDKGGGDFMLSAPQAAPSAPEAPDYSKTNVQVEGVDEADFVKNDGKYIYTVSGQNVFILSAYPPEETKIAAKINFGTEDTAKPSELFIDDNRLVVIGINYAKASKEGKYENNDTTFVKIYDTSKKEEPKEVRNIEYEGAYSASRKVDDNIYLILTSYPSYLLYEKSDIKGTDIIPKFKDSKNNQKELEPVSDCANIGYINPEGFGSFISIVSVPAKDLKKDIDKKVIAGYSENVYASSKNIYIASSSNSYLEYGILPKQNDEKTTVYKFKLEESATSFIGSFEVPGTILNQFSMDEYNDYFRIATTKGEVSRTEDEDSTSQNNVYVVDSDLKIAGNIEGLAKGEKIYSARFMGNKAYLVTFKKVDPFFTLDMSDPKNPKVLGALKIPGYSDYLHPYDENHIIGIGKNTSEADPGEGNFAWYQGMKIAIFDVTDFKNPKEMHKVLIGDRGTDSYALEDHKAFLFSKNKKLLVLPILLAELTEAQKADSKSTASTYGEYKFQGAYIYEISLEGIKLKGRVTHIDDVSSLKNQSYYYYEDNNSVKRSLYIGDYLYTVSGERIKANKLQDITETTDIKLK